MLPAAARPPLQSLADGPSTVFYGGHETLDDAELVVYHLGQRSEAVGGAGGIGDDFLSGIGVVVDAHDEHGGVVLRGGRHHDAFRTRLDVCAGEFFGQEKAGRFDHVFRTYFVPPEVRRVFLCRNAYGFAVYDEVAVLYLHGAVKMAVNGVVTEHVSHVINRNEVVDAYHLYAALLDGGTENEAADAPETVDADFNL